MLSRSPKPVHSPRTSDFLLLACSLSRQPGGAVERVEAVEAVERCDLGAEDPLCGALGDFTFTGTLHSLQVAVEAVEAVERE